MSTGAEIVMGVWPIEGRSHRGVPGQVRSVLVLPIKREHVRLVLVRSIARAVRTDERAVVVLTRIARRTERVPPTEVHAVLLPELLFHDQPRAVSGAFVLEVE